MTHASLLQVVKDRGKPILKRVPIDGQFCWECSTLFSNGVSYGRSDTYMEAFLVWAYRPDFTR